MSMAGEDYTASTEATSEDLGYMQDAQSDRLLTMQEIDEICQ